MNASAVGYSACLVRINRVFDYTDAHLAGPLHGLDFQMDKDTGAFNCLLCLPVRQAD